jgi:hypothetical protein
LLIAKYRAALRQAFGTRTNTTSPSDCNAVVPRSWAGKHIAYWCREAEAVLYALGRVYVAAAWLKVPLAVLIVWFRGPDLLSAAGALVQWA